MLFRTFSPRLEDIDTCSSDSFPHISGCVQKCQNYISMYCCSPIVGRIDALPSPPCLKCRKSLWFKQPIGTPPFPDFVQKCKQKYDHRMFETIEFKICNRAFDFVLFCLQQFLLKMFQSISVRKNMNESNILKQGMLNNV